MSRLAPRWSLLIALCLLAGCSGSSRPSCHPVRGRVLWNDEPVAEAHVVFHPVGSSIKEAPKPQAECDAQGWFELTTLKQRDGAQAGDYVITVELREPRLIGEEIVRDGPSVLPDRYARPETTPLRYTVIAGRNEMEPLKLTAE